MTERGKAGPTLARWLSEAIASRRTSPRQVAIAAHIDPAYVYRLAKGTKAAPSRERLAALCDALACTAEEREAAFALAGLPQPGGPMSVVSRPGAPASPVPMGPLTDAQYGRLARRAADLSDRASLAADEGRKEDVLAGLGELATVLRVLSDQRSGAVEASYRSYALDADAATHAEPQQR